MKLHNGFTRIDLAVTILCAAFLIMTMGAVSNRGRRRAQQLICASQLGKWGQAVIMHAEDNNGTLMFIPRRTWWYWPGNNPPCNNVGVAYPHYMGQLYEYDIQQCGRTNSGAMPGEWNVFEINPYIAAFSETYDPFADPPNCGMTNLVACPNASSDFMTQWCKWNCEDEWDFTEPSYSYWVIGGMYPPIFPSRIGSSNGESSSFVLQDLTVDTLSPDRLLMSDLLAIDEIGGVGNPYRYNHGINGWSWFAGHTVGHQDNAPFPKATGRNQFFGDGAVKWRAIPPQYEDNLPNNLDVGFLEDRWNGPGSGWVNRYDTSWY